MLSLRISPDRLGGGGEGGCEADNLGERRGSSEGVCGRLGILKAREVVGVVGVDEPESAAFKKAGASAMENLEMEFFGGDWGGSIRTEGALTGSGFKVGGTPRERPGERGTGS